MDCGYRGNYNLPTLMPWLQSCYTGKKKAIRLRRMTFRLFRVTCCYSLTSFFVITLPLCTSLSVYTPAGKRRGSKLAR
jgi:hypothetical protein